METATASKKEQKALDIAYAREQLLTHYLAEGDTVYTVLRSVSSSGMSRTMSLKVAKPPGYFNNRTECVLSISHVHGSSY